MSTTLTKRSHREALADAEDFKALFPAGSYERWEFAGSLRRKKSEVADIEHVVIPRFVDAKGDGLFGEVVRTNALWNVLDALLADGTVTKHLYGETRTTRWGDKYRGADFRGFNHELFTADANNFGAIYLIRTGPADFSERFVSRLKDRGVYRQQDGYLQSVLSGGMIPVPDEATYFEMAGMSPVEPERRA